MPPYSFARSWSRVGVLVLILTVVLYGCDTTFKAYKNRSDAYSIYGYLAENRDVQFIRIKPLDRLLSDEKDSLEATVRLENLTDGGRTTLRDSMIAYEDEESTVITHNYSTTTRIRPKTRYRLTIEHPDGATTSATTTTPASVKADITPDSAECATPITVEFPPIKDLRRARASIVLDYIPPGAERATVGTFRQEDKFQVGPDGTVFFRFRIGGIVSCGRIVSERIRLWYKYLGPKWYGRVPKDTIDIGPIESTYVDNGRGYFGALWRDRAIIILLRE